MTADAPLTPDRTRREGVRVWPIPLADGQTWGFALPALRLRPEVVAGVDALGRPDETVRVVAELGYPAAIMGLVDQLRSACSGGDPASRYEALFRLAIALLRRAHDLEPSEAAALLDLGVDDLPGLVEAVLSAVTGEHLDPSGKDSPHA